jgi:peptidoglycan/LPS O-acetylase OafA/YrhL
LKHTLNHDQRFALLEGFRGLAAMLVVYTHYWAFSDHDFKFWRFAHTGVDLFFVISGFVFGPHLFERKERWLPFLIRRSFRIYPLFAFSLLIYVFWAWQQGKPLLYLWEHFSFAYLQSRQMAFYYNPPYWSLPAEIEFYLLIPVLARVIDGKLHRFLIFLAMALCCRAVLGYFADFEFENRAFILLHHLPGILIEFLLGSLVWYICSKLEPWQTIKKWIDWQQVGITFSIVGLAIWSALAVHFAEVGDQGIRRSWLNGQIGSFAALSFSFILLGVLTALPRSFLNHRPKLTGFLVLAGSLSYGVYLFHLLGLKIAADVIERMDMGGELSAPIIGTILTIGFAWVAHRIIETPLRNFGRRVSQQLDAKEFR